MQSDGDTAFQLEYITIEEALLCTGLSEKTLKAKLRGCVTRFGQGSWDRAEFFDFWRQENVRKRERKQKDSQVDARILINRLANTTRK